MEPPLSFAKLAFSEVLQGGNAFSLIVALVRNLLYNRENPS